MSNKLVIINCAYSQEPHNYATCSIFTTLDGENWCSLARSSFGLAYHCNLNACNYSLVYLKQVLHTVQKHKNRSHK